MQTMQTMQTALPWLAVGSNKRPREKRGRKIPGQRSPGRKHVGESHCRIFRRRWKLERAYAAHVTLLKHCYRFGERSRTFSRY